MPKEAVGNLEIADIGLYDVDQRTHRLIPSRFPPIDLFERVASHEEFEKLHEIESLTNPRLRNEVGEIELVPREDLVVGQGAGYIMAPFTHINPDSGGRFNLGFGVYYCAGNLETAFEETKYHRAKFLRDMGAGATTIEMRELNADLSKSLHDIVGKKEHLPNIYHEEDYSESQALGARLKGENSWGLRYDSVRCDGTCFAVFRPPALSSCIQSAHFDYHFDGQSIVNITKKTLVQ